jgi:hypothetical protein
MNTQKRFVMLFIHASVLSIFYRQMQCCYRFPLYAMYRCSRKCALINHRNHQNRRVRSTGQLTKSRKKGKGKELRRGSHNVILLSVHRRAASASEEL